MKWLSYNIRSNIHDINGYKRLEESTRSFCSELAKFLTVYLINTLGEKFVRKLELLFYFEGIREKTLIYDGSIGKMKVAIVQKRTVMGLLSFWVEWENLKDETSIKITDNIESDEIAFKVDLTERDWVKLKYVFPDLVCSPITDKKDSGLRFDYQINGRTEEVIFKIQFCDVVSDVSEISRKVKQYFTKSDTNGLIIEPGRFVSKRTSPKVVKVEVDLGSIDCTENIIEDFMRYLDKNFDNIKKVIVD